MGNLKDIYNNAKRLCTKCNVCNHCDGKFCRGQIPGTGGKGSGDSFIRNVAKIDDIKLVMHVIGDFKDVDTSMTLFGHKCDLPVFAAPIAGILNNFGYDISEQEYNNMVLQGCKLANTIGFSGDGKDIDMFIKPLDVIDKLNGQGICTMKPWVDKGIDERIEYLKTKKVLALAMDIDSAGLPLLRNSDVSVEIKSLNDLKQIKEKCEIPFIIKGIMSTRAAKIAIKANADAIIVSNHGGRVLDQGLATIEVLNDIVKEVNGRALVLVDGGFRSGVDVFKALALGADGVLIGRPIAISAIGDGVNGVSMYLNKIKNELSDTMMMCGCKKISDINMDCIKVINKN